MDGFNMIRPTAAGADMIVSSNVVNDELDWSGDDTYADGESVAHEGHAWESLQNGNSGHEPGVTGSEDWWLDLGADNIHRMVDATIQSRTVNDETIEVVLSGLPGERNDTVFVQAVTAVSATVETIETVEEVPTVILTETVLLVDNSGVSDLWAWLFLELMLTDFALFAVPNYTGLTYRLTLDNGEGEAACGDCVLGRAVRFGGTRWEGELSFTDYSTKERDFDGGFVIVERPYSDEGSFQVWVRQGDVDFVKRELSEARAQRRVFVAYDRLRSTIINGYVTDARFVLSAPGMTLLSISCTSLAT